MTAGQETCEGEGTIFYVCDDDDTLSLHFCGGGVYYTGPAFCDDACYGVEEVMGCTYDRQVCDGDYFVMESYCGAGMEEDYCDDCLVSRSEENWPMFADLGADCPNEYGFSFVCVDGTLQQRLCVYSYGTDEIDDKTSQEYVTIISTDMICNWEDCVSYSYSYSYESDDDEQYTTVVVVWEFTALFAASLFTWASCIFFQFAARGEERGGTAEERKRGGARRNERKTPSSRRGGGAQRTRPWTYVGRRHDSRRG